MSLPGDSLVLGDGCFATCSRCDRVLSDRAKSLASKQGIPVCFHKVCLHCLPRVEPLKDGWVFTGGGCHECGTRFAKVVEAVFPGGDPKTLFKHVNISNTGRISREELVGYVTSVFGVAKPEATRVIEELWESWDIEKRGWIRSAKDGVLEPREFEKVRSWLVDRAEQVRQRMEEPIEEPPAKRPRPGGLDLKQMLLEGNGSTWFYYCDDSSDGKLQKDEVIKGLVQTLKPKFTLEEVSGIVEGIWPSIDTDKNGELELGEFFGFRQMLLVNLDLQ